MEFRPLIPHNIKWTMRVLVQGPYSFCGSTSHYSNNGREKEHALQQRCCGFFFS